MVATTRLKPFDRSILFRPGGPLSQEAGARQVAALARKAIAEAQAANEAAAGHPVSHVTFVNGVASEAFEDIRPGQSIVAVFDLASDLLLWIADQLRDASPVKTGQYRDAMQIYADGDPVPDLASAAGAGEIVFTNLVPYARKIERGQSSQAPNGVFQATAALAQQRFGNQAAIKFTYREPVGVANDLEVWARNHSSKLQSANKRRHRYLRDVRQPAIVVTLR